MDESQIGHLMLPDDHSYQPNFLQSEQLLHYNGSVVQLTGRQQQIFTTNRPSIVTTSVERQEPTDIASLLQLPPVSSSDMPASTAAHSVPNRIVTKAKKPTGSTAARLLAEQYSKTRSSHGSQTESVSTAAATRGKDRLGRNQRQRLPPKKDACLLCYTEVPENQRDRHVLRHHLKKPVYRCPLCVFASIAEPSIVRTHLRLKHREFDLAAVNCRHEFAEELAVLTRQCFGPKKRFARPPATSEGGIRAKKAKPRVPPTPTDPVQIECKVCVAKTTVRSDQVKIHVAQCHLSLPYLYGCPQESCAFGSYTCAKTVKNHLQKEHGLQTKIISEVGKNRKEMKATVIKCFGEAAWSA